MIFNEQQAKDHHDTYHQYDKAHWCRHCKEAK